MMDNGSMKQVVRLEINGSRRTRIESMAGEELFRYGLRYFLGDRQRGSFGPFTIIPDMERALKLFCGASEKGHEESTWLLGVVNSCRYQIPLKCYDRELKSLFNEETPRACGYKAWFCS
jgi:hypothetical protein